MYYINNFNGLFLNFALNYGNKINKMKINDYNLNVEILNKLINYAETSLNASKIVSNINFDSYTKMLLPTFGINSKKIKEDKVTISRVLTEYEICNKNGPKTERFSVNILYRDRSENEKTIINFCIKRII
ncbi:hypothetical protein ACQ4LE_006172 [Meloidogyne hapla]